MMTLADLLKPHVPAIQRDAAKGDHCAKEIIKLYQMHVDCPGDPGAPALCEAAFEKWRNAAANPHRAPAQKGSDQ